MENINLEDYLLAWQHVFGFSHTCLILANSVFPNSESGYPRFSQRYCIHLLGMVQQNTAKLDELNGRNVLSQSSEGWRSEIKTLAGLVPSEDREGKGPLSAGPSLSYRCHLLPSSRRIVFPLCMSVSVYKFTLFIRTPVTLHSGPP